MLKGIQTKKMWEKKNRTPEPKCGLDHRSRLRCVASYKHEVSPSLFLKEEIWVEGAIVDVNRVGLLRKTLLFLDWRAVSMPNSVKRRMDAQGS